MKIVVKIVLNVEIVEGLLCGNKGILWKIVVIEGDHLEKIEIVMKIVT